MAPERSVETNGLGGGGGQALFVINVLPHQSFVYSECNRKWVIYPKRAGSMD